MRSTFAVATAKVLLTKVECLESLPLQLGRGFPEISTLGIDALLNFHYEDITASVITPPIALALNNPDTSLTRNRNQQFSENDI